MGVQKLNISPMNTLTVEDWKRIAKNFLKFALPFWGIFVVQLQMGVKPQVAALSALYAVYQTGMDILTKWANETNYTK